jgi:WD40 domain-containing protein/cytochrome c
VHLRRLNTHRDLGFCQSSLSATLAAGLALLAALPTLATPPRVQFSRQVLPLLRKECSVCHSGAAAPAGLSMETAEKLRVGGRHGTPFIPGKSAQSVMIQYLTGALKPQMPPGKPLPPDRIALLRRWIDEGAKIDSMTLPSPASTAAGGKPGGAAARSPATASRVPALPAPVTALAFAPDGKRLAVGGYQTVRLLDPATGKPVRTLPGPVDQVQALAWSPDGKWLAAAGGLPGAFGEVCLWNTATWSRPRVFKKHTDTIYALSWRPGAPEFATASLDKTVMIWNVVGGNVTRTLKDHADAVFAVAYSPDGKWLATGSADRSVKLYQTASAARPVASLSHGDVVTAVAFSPKSDMLATACSDKQVRVWPVKAGSIDNPLRSQSEGDLINAIAFSGDGSAFVWGAANHKVKLWNGDVSSQTKELSDPADWVYAVAFSPDGKQIAAGAGDGKLYLWSAPDGKLLFSELLGPATAVVAASAKK